MKIKSIIALLLASASLALADMPKVGDTAPFITGSDQDGKEFKLTDLIGKKIVLL